MAMSELSVPIMGIAKVDLTEAIWRGVATSYIRSAYLLADQVRIASSRWSDISARTALDDGCRDGFQLGSVISAHAKLKLCDQSSGLIHFGIDHDADRHEIAAAERSFAATPESIQADFQGRVSALLDGMRVGRVIAQCTDIA